MNLLEFKAVLADLCLEETDALNILQMSGTISDNVIELADIAEADLEGAATFLQLL